MRKLTPDGVCACCGAVGAVWANVTARPLDFGTELILEANTTLPDLCDGCDFAQRRWDARQFQLKHPAYGFPYFEGPPKSPPVRQEGDRELGADGWPA